MRCELDSLPLLDGDESPHLAHQEQLVSAMLYNDGIRHNPLEVNDAHDNQGSQHHRHEE